MDGSISAPTVKKERWMNRPILVCALLLTATAALGAQEANQSNPYEGTSTPPPDDTITTTSASQVKPSAGRRSAEPTQDQQAQPTTREPSQTPLQPEPSAANAADPDGGTVAVEPDANATNRAASLKTRRIAADPDGDIVHPRPPRPGELPEGTTIHVELLDMLSTTISERGEAFRGRVNADVLQGDKVLIPAGTEIDGRVADVSSGSLGGHGSMRLQPEMMILPDGSRFQFRAELNGTRGSRTQMGNEGAVVPGSRLKRDGIEYGGAVGAGATTGAIVGGPVGALTGSLIGAGLVTVHLLVSHPQATLEAGTTLEFVLSEPLQLSPAGAEKQ
jgi:hypothetical protein